MDFILRIFLGRLENLFDILGDFLREIIKTNGKTVLEVRNTENVRLRRAKMEDFIAMLVLNRANLTKIAPEGREKKDRILFLSFIF